MSTVTPLRKILAIACALMLAASLFPSFGFAAPEEGGGSDVELHATDAAALATASDNDTVPLSDQDAENSPSTDPTTQDSNDPTPAELGSQPDAASSPDGTTIPAEGTNTEKGMPQADDPDKTPAATERESAPVPNEPALASPSDADMRASGTIASLFPDPVFAAYVASILGKSASDSVTQNELNTVVSVQPPKTVYSVEGIQYLGGLREARLDNQSLIERFPPAFIARVQSGEISIYTANNQNYTYASVIQISNASFAEVHPFIPPSVLPVRAVRRRIAYRHVDDPQREQRRRRLVSRGRRQ
ncbi:internalin N-terminal domain-containing protein [Raoultibacter phocaeensis]|uniref:internalin N-terminal domain-containing protein n=1 Tax=Raoultibacter phocaeensis TaxID=2479841 RepID=UPI00111B7F8A|nr:hypothetical protein [Raoultibacter phocaeensis]